MWHYLKFLAYNITILIGVSTLFLADFYILLGFIIFVGCYVAGDALLGNDLSQPTLNNKRVLNILLYSSVPTTLALLVSVLWLTSAGNWAVMEWVSTQLHYDFYQSKLNTNYYELFVAVLFSGLMLSGVATVVGHELVHKVGNKKAVTVGRWLMATSIDANFSIEHLFGHHINVATAKDPATAPRGRNVYIHVIYAIFLTNYSAWKIEEKRLTRKNISVWSTHNQCIRGWLMTLVWASVFFAVSGVLGLLFFFAMAFVSKAILEVVNYMEHYGLVRDPRQRVEPRHSWNSNKKISCWAMFNLPRHSHHHAKGAVPFEKLESMPDAPVMISGYIATLGLTLIPPLWFKLMKPKLEHWDRHYANATELEILNQRNDQSGKKFNTTSLV